MCVEESISNYNFRSCGNELTTSTYSIKPVKVLLCITITFSFFIGILCVIAIIVNSGLIGAATLVNCNTVQISSQLYNGTSSTTTPWSGVSNFVQFINDTSVNLLNSKMSLASLFDSSNPNNTAYTDLISTANGTLFNDSQTFSGCPDINTNTNLNCPYFPDICPSPLLAVFTK